VRLCYNGGMEIETRRFGAQGMYGRLRRVLVNRPGARYGAAFETEGAFYAAPVDLARAQAEHDALVGLLEQAGAAVDRLDGEAGPDSIYVYDPAVVCDGGAVLLRSGKTVRRAEPAAHGAWLRAHGIPVLHELAEPALCDGGDLLWLDERTLVIGRGFRTNAQGAREVADAVGPWVDEVHVVDLPYDLGPEHCLHTLSFVSMLDRDLAVVHRPLMPVALWRLLAERGVELVDVDPDEYATQAPNVLAVAPRVGIALSDNPRTIARLRAAGCTIHELAGGEVAQKGSGGPTCLTLPLLRDR
jgi:N-dimethylarginine dimethylaminohydrolase